MKDLLRRHRRFLALSGVFLGAWALACLWTPAEGRTLSEAERLHGPTVLRAPLDPDAVIEEEPDVGPPPPPPPPAGSYTEVEVKDGGTVRGVVRFTAAPASVDSIPFTKDEQHCGATEIPSERVVFDPATLTVANCVITLEGIREGKAWTGPMAAGEDEREAILDQKGCVYVPHVLVIRTNTQIKLKNSDTADHNVHPMRGSSTEFNEGSPAGSLRMPASSYIEKPGLLDVRCDVHPWMSGWVHVSDHPYIVVTGKDGRFELTDVPPGTWRVRLWHEGMSQTPITGAGGIVGYAYGADVVQVQEITVEAGQAVELEFTLEPPQE